MDETLSVARKQQAKDLASATRREAREEVLVRLDRCGEYGSNLPEKLAKGFRVEVWERPNDQPELQFLDPVELPFQRWVELWVDAVKAIEFAGGMEAVVEFHPEDPSAGCMHNLFCGLLGGGDPNAVVTLLEKLWQTWRSQDVPRAPGEEPQADLINVGRRYTLFRYFSVLREWLEQQWSANVPKTEASSPSSLVPPDSAHEKSGLPGVSMSEQTTVSGPFVFRRSGSVWEIGMAGLLTHVNHRVGMDYLRYLLANPRRKISVVEIESGGRICAEPQAAGQEMVDERANKEMRDRLASLEGTSQSYLDPAEVTQAREEAARLRSALGSARGIGGRARTIADDTERCRIRVANSIKGALRAIQAVHPPVYDHLVTYVTNPSGRRPEYSPDSTIAWSTEPGSRYDAS